MASRFRWTLTKLATNLYPQTSEVLTRDPLGWDDLTLKLSRDKLYHGVFTEFSLSLKWHCEGGGKDFIDNVYATEDVNGIIEVLIEIDCDGAGTYTDFYTGRLNLASYSTDGEFASCNIEKSDLFSKLKARDEIAVNLETVESIGQESITAIEPIQLPLHSQNLFLRSKMEKNSFSPDSISFPLFGGIGDVYSGFVSHHLEVLETEAENFTGWDDFSDIAAGINGLADTFITEVFEADDERVTYPATYTIRCRFTGSFSDVTTATQNREAYQTLSYRYGATLAGSTAVDIFFSGIYTTSVTNYSYTFDGEVLGDSILLNKGDKVWITWRFLTGYTPISPPPTNTIQWEYDIANFSIEINSLRAATKSKSILIHEAWNQVCDAIADKNVSFYSDFYGRMGSQKVGYNSNGCGSQIALTNGINIRQHDENILCSLKDLFTAFNALHNIGLTIESYDGVYTPIQDVIRVEMLSHFYDNTTQILSLTGGVKIDVSNDNTRYINDITIGYDKWETEIMAGLDEPCTKHNYSTKVNSIKGAYKKMSPYIASGYAIEITRRKLVEETTDWQYDNDNFIIAVSGIFRGRLQIFATTNPDVFDIYSPLTGQIIVGDIIRIGGSGSGNNGDYTMLSVTDIGGTVTRLTVANGSFVANETILNGTVENITNKFYIPELYADAFTDGSGMTALTTAYNLRLTPARMLLAHMNAITACIQVIRGVIAFVKGEGNTTLAAKKNDVGCQEDYNESIPYGDVILNENQNFDWNDPNIKNITPLWVPEIYKFDYPLSASQLSAIRANPHGYISVTDDHANVRKGFILDVEFMLKTGKTKFELLKMFEP